MKGYKSLARHNIDHNTCTYKLFTCIWFALGAAVVTTVPWGQYTSAQKSAGFGKRDSSEQTYLPKSGTAELIENVEYV